MYAQILEIIDNRINELTFEINKRVKLDLEFGGIASIRIELMHLRNQIVDLLEKDCGKLLDKPTD